MVADDHTRTIITHCVTRRRTYTCFTGNLTFLFAKLIKNGTEKSKLFSNKEEAEEGKEEKGK